MSISNRFRAVVLAASLAALAATARAGGEQALERVVVHGSAATTLGIADAASVGTVTRAQLEARTVYRPAELLEAVPGLVVTQHSGEGKATQFFLRGFNLDHGSDLRITVEGMPVNQRSHAHGQGWSDLNFVIPELTAGLRYRKGPYDASDGDFASAGAVEIDYVDALEQGIASVGLGERGWRRVLLADAPALGRGRLLYALEGLRNDGPWTHPDRYRKLNGVLRWSEGSRSEGWHATLMAYDARWNATDQIPRRAVAAGTLGRLDTVDASDGGRAQRYSLSGEWRGTGEASATKLGAYVVASELALYSNFTYALDDPLNGDQFAQPDRRTTLGLNASRAHFGTLLGREAETTVGLQLQHDDIRNALLKTRQRRTLSTTRRDRIDESSLGLHAQTVLRWTPTLRTLAGLRADHYRFEVDSDAPLNSGRASDTVVNPKLGLVLGPYAQTEFYANAGGGFHSNDARGTVIRVDPASGEPAARVTPLARSRGWELGLRSTPWPGLQTSFVVYRLDLDSELLFVGDAGGTEASRPSRRNGFEWASVWKPNGWLTLDADLAYARARFRDRASEGRRIPGAVEGVATLAAAIDHGSGFGALQWRWFGPRPLVEDGSVRSRPSATLNGRIGWRLTPAASVELEGFNLTDRRDSAIDYFYASRLPGESAPVEDVHFHPIEGRSLRLTLTLRY